MRLRIITTTLLGSGVAALITGCAATVQRVALPSPRPLGAEFASVGRDARDAQPARESRVVDGSASKSRTLSGRGTHPTNEGTGPLTLRQALALASMRNPELTAFSHEVRAAEARVRQARLLPNPDLEIGVGEIDRERTGFDSAETEITVGQRIEIGGKRCRRAQMARAESELAGWDYEAKRLDVISTTAHRFSAVVVAQRRVELSAAAVELADKTAQAVRERVKAGKEPPMQAAKANVEVEMARMTVLTANSVLRAARAKLVAMWGSDKALFQTAEGDLDRILDAVPSLQDLQACLANTPELARWEAELRLREAAVAAEKTARLPDVEVAIGVVRVQEEGTDSIAFGVGVPLPLFDRNQGNIAVAKQEWQKAKAERRAARTALTSELAETHAALTSAHGRLLTLRSKVVPAVAQAFEAAHEGYRQGKFGFLDMLDAQRGLFEAKGALLDALADYHAALTDIERLTATSIE